MVEKINIEAEIEAERVFNRLNPIRLAAEHWLFQVSNRVRVWRPDLYAIPHGGFTNLAGEPRVNVGKFGHSGTAIPLADCGDDPDKAMAVVLTALSASELAAA